jgi:hypothetical protein
MHVEQVLGHLPQSERCQGHAAPVAAGSQKSGWFGFLKR